MNPPHMVLRLHPADNVAILVRTTASRTRLVFPYGDRQIELLDDIEMGHKVAVAEIPEGGPVIKFGASIGHATQFIRKGQWVHLHNCASNYDTRSNTLDRETGAPTDVVYQ